MNENVKKGLLGLIVLIAAGIAIYEGIKLTSEPKLQPSMSFGTGTPGHGMKAAEKAEESKAAAAMKSGNTQAPPTGGDVAGDVPPPPSGK